jgi:hypothetical protein
VDSSVNKKSPADLGRNRQCIAIHKETSTNVLNNQPARRQPNNLQ